MSTTVDLISDYNTELGEIRAAKRALLSNGQEHSLNGSHSFKGVPYKELVRREQQLLSALASLNGGKSYTIPDFS